MKKVITIGEILVEIMATEIGDGFLEAISLVGPFPSGAPAIFIDQVAKLGQPCGMIGCVGEDDFGRVNIERLRRDGVDVSAIAIDPDRPTGSAFVRYRADGSRDFVYNIRHSASGAIAPTAAATALIDSADHLHVMGSALSSPALVEMVRTALQRVRSRGGTVSFDPNLRKEMLGGARDARSARRSPVADRPVPAERGRAVPAVRDGTRPSRSASSSAAASARSSSRKAPRAPSSHDAAGTVFGAGLPGRGGRSDRRRRHLRRHLRHLLAARPSASRGVDACQRRGSARRRAQGADGGDVHPGRARAFPEPSDPEGVRMSSNILADLPRRHASGDRVGLTSVCSAHPLVIEAALRLGKEDGTAVLIEATCNQVNQEGGYTGMTPAGLPRLRRGHRRQGGVRARGSDPRRRSSRAESVEAPAAGRGAGARPHDGGGLRAGRLHQDPPRHQHGLRRRERRPCR